MTHPTIEAARHASDLIRADAKRLDDLLHADRTHDAEYISTVVQRAATLASLVAAMLTGLAAGLPEAVREDCEAHFDAGEAQANQRERDAWADGLQAGTHGAADAPH